LQHQRFHGTLSEPYTAEATIAEENARALDLRQTAELVALVPVERRLIQESL
jgi:hypothetical protein